MRQYRTLRFVAAFAGASLVGLGPAYALNNDMNDGGDFAQTLSRHYDALARVEQAQGDTRDARAYALRATAAADGNPTEPDSVAHRRPYLKEEYVNDLDAARARLVGALDGEARTRAGSAAADAQAAYDCWLEQAAEDLQPDDIAACRNAFESAMGAVDQRLAQVEAPPPPPPPEPAPPPAPSSYLVFFDFDRAEITSEARDILQGMVRDAQGQDVTRLTATGHTDTAGSAAYNQRLSQRRANAVREALNGMGVQAEEIVTEARGEAEPLVPTGDGVREPQNRRVEINVER